MQEIFSSFWDRISNTSLYRDCLGYREELLRPMTSKFEQGMNCSSCQGYCCTFEHNSMLVTPIEAIELYSYLVREQREDFHKVLESIETFRLDKNFLGGSKTFRRYYTCPFFIKGAKGCSISPESKPMGCLAFNPHKKLVTTPGHCSSDLDALQKVDQMNGELFKKINKYLKEELGLYWDKESIPIALKDLNRIFKNFE